MSSPVSSPPPTGSPWLFDRATDLWMFGGSTALSLLLLAAGTIWTPEPGQTPVWLWLAIVVGVDVAHVHSTWFRTLLEPEELKRSQSLYWGAITGSLGIGILLHVWSGALFWTCAAYLAVFHFVRQQVGWMTLYRARAHESPGPDAWLELGTLYACTLWPLIWWHAHLPQPFSWFISGDFVLRLPEEAATWTFPLYLAFLVIFGIRHLQLGLQQGRLAWGKLLLVGTTCLTWYLGIVGLRTDLAFTVTNVLPHGIPYLIAVWRFTQRSQNPDRPGVTAWVWRRGPLLYLMLVMLAALIEEGAWDLLVWHDHAEIFGIGTDLPDWQDLLVPLLALPQLVHYVLDGYIWRRRSNPEVHRQTL